MNKNAKKYNKGWWKIVLIFGIAILLMVVTAEHRNEKYKNFGSVLIEDSRSK